MWNDIQHALKTWSISEHLGVRDSFLSGGPTLITLFNNNNNTKNALKSHVFKKKTKRGSMTKTVWGLLVAQGPQVTAYNVYRKKTGRCLRETN